MNICGSFCLVTSLPSIWDSALNSCKTNLTRLKKDTRKSRLGAGFTVMLLLHVRRGETKTLNCKPPGNAIATGTLTPTSSGLKQAQSHSKKKRTNWTFIWQFDWTLGSVRTGRYGAHGQHRAQNVTLGGCSVTFYLHCDKGSSAELHGDGFSFSVALRGFIWRKKPRLFDAFEDIVPGSFPSPLCSPHRKRSCSSYHRLCLSRSEVGTVTKSLTFLNLKTEGRAPEKVKRPLQLFFFSRYEVWKHSIFFNCPLSFFANREKCWQWFKDLN